MSVRFFGKMFDSTLPWSPYEHDMLESVQRQIDQRYPTEQNIVVNLTWFGPQFTDNGTWYELKDQINAGLTCDRLFWVNGVDPICILPDALREIEQQLKAKQVYYLGAFDNSPCSFHLSAVATHGEFIDYNESDLILQDIQHIFLCYNRRPKPHRIQLVEKIFANQLDKLGKITLGKIDCGYDVSQGLTTNLFLTLDEPIENYTRDGKYRLPTEFGIPYDHGSLGRLDTWQGHFLNIVSETEFFPWDNLFVTEKTWKPMIGLRPFIINGQTTLYAWLRQNDFRTFNHWFKDIELEHIHEHQVHDAIINVIKYLSTFDKQQLLAMYNQMLPDLMHNRKRFFEFAKQQKLFIENLPL